MTESEWDAATDPTPMLTFLRGTGLINERKLRLFAVAACRRIWHLMTDERIRTAVLRAEEYADGAASSADLGGACAQADVTPLAEQGAGYAAAAAASAADVADDARDMVAHTGVAAEDASWAAYWAAHAAYWAAHVANAEEAPQDHRIAGRYEAGWDTGQAARDTERRAQAVLLRDIVGPLACRTLISPGAQWLAPSVVALAQSAYDDRILPTGALASARLGALACALEAAACQDAELVGHLRGPGPHVRGCWVVDLLLGKS